MEIKETECGVKVEAEYRSMASTTCEATWLLYLLNDFHVSHDKPVLMYCDNQAALHISVNPVFHERFKHIEADCHIVRNRVLDGTIKIFHVSSRNQLADIFTKAIGVDSFLRLLKRLGVINIFAQSIHYPEYLSQNQKARALLLKESVESKKGCIQDNSKHRNRAEEVSTDQATNTQTNWDNAKLLDLIEAVPYHEHFIHTSEEAMPCG